MLTHSLLLTLLDKGVDQWEFLSGQTTASPRQWLLYETHPQGSKKADLVHGSAMVLGDMKLIQIGSINPSGK
jgi:hypothetical protein